MIIKEKMVIAYTCSGPTYRESALQKLEEVYFDNENIYYCILTDDKSFFDGVKRKNVIVNELKDFYSSFLKLGKNEFFLDSVDKNDYSTKFVKTAYLFPFSLYRFNLLQAIKLGIKNVALLCTDVTFDFTYFDNLLFDNANYIYNACSEWDVNWKDQGLDSIADRLKNKFNLHVDETVRALDGAARFFVLEDLATLEHLFTVWNDIIEDSYETGLINKYKGPYAINDEYILALVYNALDLNKDRRDINYRIFDVRHDSKKERYWRTCGAGELLEHHIYEDFMKINNLT